VAIFTQLASGNWRVQLRRKTRYVAETFRRRKEGEEWALEMERNIDRKGSSKPRAVRNVRTFGDLIDLHDEDMHEVGKPPRRSKAAVMAALKDALGSVKLPAPQGCAQGKRLAVAARRFGAIRERRPPCLLGATKNRPAVQAGSADLFATPARASGGALLPGITINTSD
jgi:hypothetical protein